MSQKLLIVFLFLFHSGNAQQFSLENLQTNEQIEVALDSAYNWMQYDKTRVFTENYLIIEEAIEQKNNEEYKARFNAYKATFHYYLYDYKNFNSLLNEALAYYEQHTDAEMLIYLYNLKGISTLYADKKNLEGIAWYKKSLELATPGDEKLEQEALDVYHNLASIHSRCENWDAAYEASSRCIELAKKYSPSRLPRMYYIKGLALFNKNDIKGAISNYKLAEDYVTKKELEEGKKTYYKNTLYLLGLSDVYKMQKDFEKSADYLRKYHSRIDEGMHIYSKTIGERARKNKDLFLNLAKRKEEKAEEDLRKSEAFYTLLVLGLAALIIGVLLIFIFQQRKHEKLNIKKNTLLTSKNSELISIKEKIENALKVKTDFLNSITHELRTPLYAINSITHMIKQGNEIKIDASQVDILTFSGDHLLRFINDVIDYNVGHENYEAQQLILEGNDLISLLHKIKKTIKYSLVMNNENQFIFDFGTDIYNYLKFDSLKLSRIIINLLNNASKYTHKGEIHFSAKQLDITTDTTTILFCIKDNGQGISKKQLDEINIAFNNNQDLVKRIDNKASGLGMGLVMVNRLLKLHHSELIIESEEGVGSTMTFQITFNIDDSFNSKDDVAITQIKQQKHVLIVDDNKINQLVTSKIIINQGNTCDIAKGGEEAIAMINNNYDIILMDIMMPGMDGFQATEIIKTMKPDQKIIALTAISLRENKQKFIDSGFEHVIEKPFNIDQFNALLA